MTEISGSRQPKEGFFINALLVFIIVGVGSCNVLNQTGFCKERMHWVSDDEKIAFALTHWQRDQSTKKRLEFADAFKLQHPNCCKVYARSELLNGHEFVEWGWIPRPAYIRIKGADREDNIVSSCANAWEPWRDGPRPLEDPMP